MSGYFFRIRPSQNYVSGGSDQVQGLIRSSSVGAWKMFAGHVQATNDGTGIPSSTCNVKYVYDGSDYTTFKKTKQSIARTMTNHSAGMQAMRLKAHGVACTVFRSMIIFKIMII